jgi:hypothetical protein
VPAVVSQVTTRIRKCRGRSPSACLGEQNDHDNRRRGSTTSRALLPTAGRAGLGPHGVSTFRQATRVNPARSEDRKMVYDGNFLHFMVRGSVGQYFQRAGGRPARARTDHPAVVGSTEMPRHHILAVHLARLSRPTRRRTHQSLRCHWTSVRTHTAEVYAHSTSGSDVECDIPRGCNSQTAVSAERTLSRGLNRLRSSWFGT